MQVVQHLAYREAQAAKQFVAYSGESSDQALT